MKIRSDFEGITIVRVGTRDVVLRAGDTVPEGVYVGVHLIETKVEPDEAAGDGSETNEEPDEADESSEAGADKGASLEIPSRHGPGSSTEAWRAYAVAAAAEREFNIDIPEDAGRAEIIEALASAGIPVE